MFLWPLTCIVRYDFVPPVKYNYLDADEAEERFERRDKTLNYFSIMLSKKLKGQQEEREGPGEEGAGLEEGLGSKKTKKLRRKTREEEDGLVSVFASCLFDDPLPFHNTLLDANRQWLK